MQLKCLLQKKGKNETVVYIVNPLGQPTSRKEHKNSSSFSHQNTPTSGSILLHLDVKIQWFEIGYVPLIYRLNHCPTGNTQIQ